MFKVLVGWDADQASEKKSLMEEKKKGEEKIFLFSRTKLYYQGQ